MLVDLESHYEFFQTDFKKHFFSIPENGYYNGIILVDNQNFIN